MSEDTTYNGWTNRATWCVNLWLDNEESTYHQVREIARDVINLATDPEDISVSPLADALRDFVEELAEATCPGVIEGASFVSDLFGAQLQAVDWYEIAKNLLDEVGAEDGE